MKLVYPYTIFNSRRAEQVKTTIAGPCLYSASEFIANVYILVKITKLSTPIKQVVFPLSTSMLMKFNYRIVSIIIFRLQPFNVV